MRYLLDTHTLIWWIAGDGRLSDATRAVLANASPDTPLHLASISRWEIAKLVSRGRVAFSIPIQEWIERATVSPVIKVHDISPSVAREVAALPDSFPRDPADRLIVATARHIGATVLTVDQQIVGSALVPTLT